MSRVAVNVVVDLPLPRRCNEGKQDGDDDLLAHIHYDLFVEYCTYDIIVWTVFEEIAALRCLLV